jgi:hypothetical protein
MAGTAFLAEKASRYAFLQLAATDLSLRFALPTLLGVVPIHVSLQKARSPAGPSSRLKVAYAISIPPEAPPRECVGTIQAKINSTLTVDAVEFLTTRSEVQTRAARRWTPDPNEARPFETDQQPSRSHRVPLLSGPKGWHILSIQFPRHCVVAHEPCSPDFSNDGCQGPSPQVGGDHMGQGTRRSTPAARHSIGEHPFAVRGIKIFHFRTRQ